MLWLQDVPGFEWVYIHTGNKRGHTEGCLLVGDSLNNNQQAETYLYPIELQVLASCQK